MIVNRQMKQARRHERNEHVLASSLAWPDPTLESDNDRHLDVELLCGIDNALGNHVTSYNTTEDVDND